MDPMLVWGLGLLAASVLLLFVEIFVPSGGVIATTAAIVGLAGVVCLFLMKEGGSLWGVSGSLMLVIVFPSAFVVWMKVLPNTSIGQKMMGIVSEEELAKRADRERDEHDELEALVGMEGVARSPLRPVGSILIAGQTRQALAEGVAIEATPRSKFGPYRTHRRLTALFGVYSSRLGLESNTKERDPMRTGLIQTTLVLAAVLSAQTALAQAGAAGGGTDIWVYVVLGIVGLFLLIIALVLAQYISLFVQAYMSNASVSPLDLVRMRFRKIDPRIIVLNRIRAVQAGLPITTAQLEEHLLSGGRVKTVVSSLIAAKKAKIELDWDTACAIDLAGRDILEAVNTSVNPKVIDCPNPSLGRSTIDAVARDGIQLKARARVTVRTNLSQLVGGATEETIVARVGEGIVSSIGSAESHKKVLENPDEISKTVMARGLDSGTAYEILSIDIADIDVGTNIGAKLQQDQAEADTKVFQALAEKRRAMAIAQEQEFKAEIEKNRALVVLAEAEIPKAMAEAFRNGNFGIMDYQRLRNIEADTSMRNSISDPDSGNNRPAGS